MKEVIGNLWDYHEKGHWVAITTNGFVKRNGEAVMGRGVALEAKKRFPRLPEVLGLSIKFCGNTVRVLGTPPFLDYKLVAFPVKHRWWERADVALIEEGCKLLSISWPKGVKLYMVRPGCGNGGLDWKDVRPILEKYLDDRFVVVQW